MVVIRHFNIEDFITELKANGQMEVRSEILRVPKNDGFTLDYNLVLTGMTKNRNILRIDVPLAYGVLNLEEHIKTTEIDLLEKVNKLKEELKTKESISFKSGIYEE